LVGLCDTNFSKWMSSEVWTENRMHREPGLGNDAKYVANSSKLVS